MTTIRGGECLWGRILLLASIQLTFVNSSRGQIELTSVISSPGLGDNFSFTCLHSGDSYRDTGGHTKKYPKEGYLNIYRKDTKFDSTMHDGEHLLTQWFNAILEPIGDTEYYSAYSEARMTFNNSMNTLTVAGATCEDHAKYYQCVVWKLRESLAVWPGEVVKNASNQRFLVENEAIPAKPTLVYEFIVGELVNVSFNCTAKVNKSEGISWKLKVQGTWRDVTHSNSSFTVNNKIDSTTHKCTNTIESVLTVTSISSMYQYFRAACFEHGQQLPCGHAETDNCLVSKPIAIQYPMKSVELTKSPAGNDSVNVTCYADSYPKPTYTWIVLGSTRYDNIVNRLQGSQVFLPADDPGQFCCTAVVTVFDDQFQKTECIKLNNGDPGGSTPKTKTKTKTKTTGFPADSSSTDSAGRKPTEPESRDSSGLRNETVALIVVCSIIGGCLIGGAAYYYFAKKQKPAIPREAKTETPEAGARNPESAADVQAVK